MGSTRDKKIGNKQDKWGLNYDANLKMSNVTVTSNTQNGEANTWESRILTHDRTYWKSFCSQYLLDQKLFSFDYKYGSLLV